MAKFWREASSLIIASKINFSNVIPKSSSRGNELTFSYKNMENFDSKYPDFKILLLRRSSSSSFMPNGYVFPGGVAVPFDSCIAWKELFNASGYSIDRVDNVDHLAPIFQGTSDSTISKVISLRITAIRETFEECGILLCRGRHNCRGDLNWASYLSGEEMLDWQRKVQEKPSEFINLFKMYECVPDVWALHLWSNWLTPVTFPKRFDTAFFIALLDQTPPTFIDNAEVDEKKWCTTSDIMKEQSIVPPPQLYEIARLNNFKTLDQLASFAIERAKLGCERWMPIQVKTSDGVVGFLPGDDMYPNSPELFKNTPAERFKETMEELRLKSTQLHRWESNGKEINRFFTNIEHRYGHLFPMVDN